MKGIFNFLVSILVIGLIIYMGGCVSYKKINPQEWDLSGRVVAACAFILIVASGFIQGGKNEKTG